MTLKEILLPASVVGINPISTSYQSIIEDATNIALKYVGNIVLLMIFILVRILFTSHQNYCIFLYFRGSNMFSSVTDHWLRMKPELQNESWRNIIDKYGQQIKVLTILLI